MRDKPRVLVIGAGSIGGYIGGSLALAGREAAFLCRPHTAAALAERGLSIAFPDGLRLARPGVYSTAEEALRTGPFDLVVLAVKRYDTAAALEPLMPFSASLPPVLTLQNGIGAAAEATGLLGGAAVIPGTVTTAVGRPEAARLVVERFRGMGVAGEHPDAAAWTAELTRCGLNARYYASADAMTWSKLLTNLIGNPSSAILDMSPAEIFAHPGLFRLELQQLREAMAVMRTMSVPVVDLPGTPVRLLAFAAGLPSPLARRLLSRSLGRGRGGKMPSFHVDLHGGIGKSEIGYLHGAVADAGRRLGIPTPVNALLVELLSSLVAGETPLDKYRRRPDFLLKYFAQRGNI